MLYQDCCFSFFWKRYKGDNKILEDRTDYFISDYQELMRYCRIAVVVGIIPIVNIFVALILLVVNVCVLIWWLTYNIVGFNWIPNKKSKRRWEIKFLRKLLHYFYVL